MNFGNKKMAMVVGICLLLASLAAFGGWDTIAVKADAGLQSQVSRIYYPAPTSPYGELYGGSQFWELILSSQSSSYTAGQSVTINLSVVNNNGDKLSYPNVGFTVSGPSGVVQSFSADSGSTELYTSSWEPGQYTVTGSWYGGFSLATLGFNLTSPTPTPSSLTIITGNTTDSTGNSVPPTFDARTGDVVLQNGGTVRFSIQANFSSGPSQDVTSSASWSSNNTAAVTISNGLATAVGPGVATITTSWNGLSTTEAVQVQAPQPSSLTLTPKTITDSNGNSVAPTINVTTNALEIQNGGTIRFAAQASFSNGSPMQDVTSSASWSSSNTATVTVSNGLATGVGSGSATITASWNGLSATTNVQVQQVAQATLQSITITPTSRTINVGQSAQFSAVGNYSNGSTQDVSNSANWSISTNGIASVSSTGGVTGISTGTTQITASFQGMTGTATLTVVTPQSSQQSSSSSSSPADTTTTPPTFTDLSGYGWAENAINSLAGQGIIEGVGPGLFDPAGEVTRAQFAALMQRAFSLSEPSQPVTFSDIQQSDWEYSAVEAMTPYMDYYNQIGGGYAFHPNQPIDRQDVAVIMVRLLISQDDVSLLGQSNVQSVLANITDAGSIATALQPYVATAIENKIMVGMPGGDFDPFGILNRAQVAVIIERMENILLTVSK